MIPLHFLTPIPQQHHPRVELRVGTRATAMGLAICLGALSLVEAEGGVGTGVEQGTRKGGTADAISAGGGSEEVTL